MTDKFLKRFEKLENLPADQMVEKGIQISRRFERLEVGDKRIEVAITDRISNAETAPSSVNYWIICPYCGAENTVDADHCVLCKHALKTKLTQAQQEKAHLMKKCSVCGAVNQDARRNCWVCGKSLFDSEVANPEENTTNTIILNIEGKEYRSTDENLPLDIRELMERIRRRGYSKALIDEWAKEKAEKERINTENMRDRIDELRTQYNLRRNQIIFTVGIILLYLILRAIFSR
jgi:ribosomal protein L40E